jgi:hypothetical protein
LRVFVSPNVICLCFPELQVEDPLDQAIKFLQPLQEWGSNHIEVHLLAFEVYLRKGI